MQDSIFNTKTKEVFANQTLSNLAQKELESITIKETIEWQSFKISDLFTPQNGDFDIQKSHLNDKGIAVISAGLENAGVVGKTDIKARILPRNTITCDMFGNVFYRDFEYKMVTHARVMCLHPKIPLTRKTALYIVAGLGYLRLIFSFANMATWTKIKDLTVLLPVLPTHTTLASNHCENSKASKDVEYKTLKDSNSKEAKYCILNFSFMESFIKAIEKECIKDLVLWQERERSAYQKVVKCDK